MSLARKTVWTLVNKLLVSGLGFVNSVLLAHFNSKFDYGRFQASASCNSVATYYMDGFTSYYAYVLAKGTGNAVAVTQMGNLFAFDVSIIVTVLLLGFTNVAFVHLPLIWWWACLCLPLSVLFNYGTKLLLGLNAITWLNRANAFQPFLLFLFAVTLFLNKNHWPPHTRLTLTYIAWLCSFMGAAIFALIVAYQLIQNRDGIKWRFHRDEWRGMIRYGTWLSVASAINIVNYRTDFWFVLAYWPALTSEYSIAVTASEVLLQISGSITTVVFTRMTGSSREDAIHITELSVRHTLIASILAAVPMYLVFPWLIVFAYGHKYVGAVIPFLILLPGLIFRSSSNVLIQYATNQMGSPKTSIWMNGVSAAINALVCLFLVPTLHTIGAAVASTLSYILSFGIYVVWFGQVNKVDASRLYLIQGADLKPYFSIAKRLFGR